VYLIAVLYNNKVNGEMREQMTTSALFCFGMVKEEDNEENQIKIINRNKLRTW
jgi:hypothetical protein